MSDQPPDNGSNGASFAAHHPQPPPRNLKVAPTDGSEKFNTIRVPLIPVACWRLNDPAFAFDSSFVSPTFKGEVSTLVGLVEALKDCPATIFGHCDPAGSDALNKTLGDRRAIAIYALLTRQPPLWEYLYANSQVGDTWDLRMTQTILANLPDPSGAPYYAGAADGARSPATKDAVTRFQGDNGLATDGDPGPATRKVLLGAYMDWLCTPAGANSPPSSPLMLPTDFLGGQGAAAGDLPKMSLQSCGKFNPLVLLPTSEMSETDTTSRNADDAPNRRVMMFFFKKGTKVDPGVWPCPKVKESNAACSKAFWPDGDARRKNGDDRREYTQTHDTMACRFYDRFARRSPCERLAVVPSRTLKLYFQRFPGKDGADADRGVAGVEYLLKVDGSAVQSGTTAADGSVNVSVPIGHAASVDIFGTTYNITFYDTLEAETTVTGQQRRLSVLGYELGAFNGTVGEATDRATLNFQADQGLQPSGVIDATTQAKLKSVFGE
jgi:peptidoglycan hydrolase-like protein with peptidoglycan-binding domain/outer membrane protein OmpA-like peptidoglycan-associated protein